KFNIDKIYDIAIAIDVASKDRMSVAEKTFNNANFKVNIDHHKTNNNYGEYNLIDGDASSAGEILFGLFEELNIEITKDIATALYTSIITDTGCFKYNSTTPKSMEICSKLLLKNIEPSYIAGQIYGNKPKPMVMLSAYAVSNTKFTNNGKIAYSTVTLSDLEKFNAESDHTEGIVELLKEINTVEVAILFKELKSGFTKISFRSKNIDVAKISSKFNGGGHTNAAGCTIKKPMNIAIDKVLEELKDI
ncbi:bifunctional oligoribonuclease/PAP phosphatase NrnA, partial [bacterium]|nr:bifunctional oligoribonuclease/PAP phosphatase NrnA [bacterium]